MCTSKKVGFPPFLGQYCSLSASIPEATLFQSNSKMYAYIYINGERGRITIPTPPNQTETISQESLKLQIVTLEIAVIHEFL